MGIASTSHSINENIITFNWVYNTLTSSPNPCSSRRSTTLYTKRPWESAWTVVETNDNAGAWTTYPILVNSPGTWNIRIYSEDWIYEYDTEFQSCQFSYITAQNQILVDVFVPNFPWTPDPPIQNQTITTTSYNTWIEGNVHTVSGIANNIAIQCVNGQYRINGGSWVSSEGFINPGDTLQMRVMSPSGGGYSTFVTVVFANRHPISLIVTTPVVTTLVYLQSTGEISMRDLAEHYGPPPSNAWDLNYQYGPTTNLSAYYRGGGRVPNIPQNNNIPTSGAISLQNFYNAAAEFGMLNAGSGFGMGTWLNSGPSNAFVQWNIGSLRLNPIRAEYRTQVTLTGGTNLGGKRVEMQTGHNLVSGGSFDSGWSADPLAPSIILKWNNTRGDAEARGTITLSARSVRGGVVISQTVDWYLELVDIL